MKILYFPKNSFNIFFVILVFMQLFRSLDYKNLLFVKICYMQQSWA